MLLKGNDSYINSLSVIIWFMHMKCKSFFVLFMKSSIVISNKCRKLKVLSMSFCEFKLNGMLKTIINSKDNFKTNISLSSILSIGYCQLCISIVSVFVA